MNKLKRIVVALCAMVGVVAIGQTAAHATFYDSAQCYNPGTNKFYVHAPYDHDHNGYAWSWATPVLSGTSVDPADISVGCEAACGGNGATCVVRIDEVDLQAWNGSSWYGVAANYESHRSLTVNTDTVYAVAACTHNLTYRTVVQFYNMAYQYIHYASATPGRILC